MFEFMPTKKTRSFDCEDLKGKMVTISLQELDGNEELQWIVFHLTEFELFFSGWVPKLGQPGTKIKKKIISSYIMEHMNGGRSDYMEYSSYKAFFNPKKKQEVLQYWSAGLMGRVMGGGGDRDTIDVTINFGKFEVADHGWMKAPEEWYSELHCDKNIFKFVDGFYKSASDAIEKFSQKSNEDLFGTRFFPIIVFPKNIKTDIRKIVVCSKCHSKPIVTKKYIIVGARCDDCYTSLIKSTYDAGGFVPIGCQWDWDS